MTIARQKDPDAAVPTTLGARLPRKDEQPAEPSVRREVPGARTGVFELDGMLHTDMALPPLPTGDVVATDPDVVLP